MPINIQTLLRYCFHYFIFGIFFTLISDCPLRHPPTAWADAIHAYPRDPQIEQSIAVTVSQLTLEQKVAQMLVAEIRSITPEEIKQYRLGAVVSGGGSFPGGDKNASVSDWTQLAAAYRRASMDNSPGYTPIPLLWATDAVHGHNNAMGATLFPHNIGLGATNNPELLEQIGLATAAEVAATGINWVLAPSVAVARDDRWGRTYESYSEDPQRVQAYAGRIVTGLQKQHNVIATAKHFIADGGTYQGQDGGDTRASEARLQKLHAPAYYAALKAGVQTVMASFNSWNGAEIHSNHYLLTEILKQQLGFDGILVGDWNGHGKLPGCTNSSCPRAINAGLDMLMAPDNWKSLLYNTIAQVRTGEIPESRIDDAVTRILRVKMRAGLFEDTVDLPAATALGADRHRQLARRAVRESLVLLKNKGGLLPLSRRQNVLVVGQGADNIAAQSGGWSLTWQGTGNNNSDFPGATSIYEGIRQVVETAGGQAMLSPDGSFTQRPDVAVAIYGEGPYAESAGDRPHIIYQHVNKKNQKMLQRLKAQGIAVVSIFLSGRPLLVNKELNASDAFVVAWLPGTEGAGIADVIFKNTAGDINYDFVGKLSFSWPRYPSQARLNLGDKDYSPLFPYGFGLSYGDKDTLADNLPEIPPPMVTTFGGDKIVKLFEQHTQPPWKLFLGDSNNWNVPVDNLSAANPVVTTQGSTNVTITEIARDSTTMPGDSTLKIVWRGIKPGQIFWQSSEPLDFSGMLAHDTALQLQLRLDQLPAAAVTARMDCIYPCSGAVSIRNQLQRLPIGKWSQLSIDLQCFANAGTNFTQVNSPLVIMSDASLALSFSRLEFVPRGAGVADIRCRR